METSLSQLPAPFAERFVALRSARGLSLRQLARRTRELDPGGKGLSSSYLGTLTTGEQAPSTHAVELIAAALEVPADFFAEYRLAKLRAAFDERKVGVVEALGRLELLEQTINPTLSQRLTADRGQQDESRKSAPQQGKPG